MTVLIRIVAVSCLLHVFLSIAPAAWARTGTEGFVSVDGRLAFNADGMVSGRHEIRVNVHGKDIKRGIFLNFPRHLGRISNVMVTRDGAREPFFWAGGGKRDLRTGTKDVRLEPGLHDYVITYRIKRPFAPGPSGAPMFRWRPFMLDSDLPWERASLDVTWPAGMAPEGMSPDAQNIAYRWRGSLGGPGDGDVLSGSVSLVWAAGTFPEIAFQTVGHSRPLRYGAPSLALLILLVFHLTWRAVGRDRRPGVIQIEGEVPAGISPAAARYIRRMRSDLTTNLTALVSLTTKGAISLERTDRELTIRDIGGSREQGASIEERALVKALFERGPQVTVRPGKGRIGRAFGRVGQSLSDQYRGRMFKRNLGPWTWCVLLVGALAIWVAFRVVAQTQLDRPDTFGIALGIASVMAAQIGGLAYLNYFKAPTRQGRAVMDRIEGLHRYLAEDSPLRESEATVDHFFELLPYAVALDDEEAWEKRFGDHLPSSDENTEMSALLRWYRAIRARDDGAAATLSAAMIPIMAASTASGSSSSSGFSGGGGGSAGGW